MPDTLKLYKGNIIFTKDKSGFTCVDYGHILVRGGKVADVFARLPEKYMGVSCEDFGDRLIIPAFVDTHLHAAQFENICMGFDKELLPWLREYTFPEERRFADPEYAKAVYLRFTDELVRQGTTRAVMFATIHTEATDVLFDVLEKRGLGAYVGKVNMDRNSDGFLDEDTQTSLRETEEWITRHMSAQARIKPIITPRFTPSCSDELMRGLGKLAAKYQVPVQSHLDENRNEIKLVAKLSPDSPHYADTYDKHGLFGDTPTIMAHCVYLTPPEVELIKQKGVFIAHCPASNLNLASGIAPVRRFLDYGINVSLGTDVAGGHTLSMANAIVSAIQSSKMYNVAVDESCEPLTLAEAFYLATKAGGKFFAPDKVGSFEKGYDFDALVIDDSQLQGGINKHSLTERLERYIYMGSHLNIYKRFAFGAQL